MVTDAGRGSAISIIRSLGRAGWRVIAADSNANSLGFRSRYATDTVLYPRPEQARNECVDALWQAAREKNVELIIPVTDAVILPLSEARARFAGMTKLAIPPVETLAVVTDKLRTLALAEELEVPAPRTCIVNTVQEAVEQSATLGWPLVLKPRASRQYRDSAAIDIFEVCYAADVEQLKTQMGKFEGRCSVLLQEYYAGVGYGVELLLDQGHPLAIFQHKRLREIPVHGGASALRESVALDGAMVEHACRMMAALQWTGLAMVEFKVGKAGPKLMEINGRVWGSLPLAVHSGMDFPRLAADLYLEQGYRKPENGVKELPNTTYKIGVRSRNLELEMLWIATVLYNKRDYPFFPTPGRWQAVHAMLQLLNPAYKFDNLVLDDPQPGLAEVPRVFNKLLGKMKAL